MVILLLMLLIIPFNFCCAQSGPQNEAYFLGVKKTDRVGKKDAYPDGKPDAVFSLRMTSEAPEAEVVEIEIRKASAARHVWSTNPKVSGTGFMAVADSRTPSVILNPKPGPLSIKPAGTNDLLLFITDDGRISAAPSGYTVKVTQRDGTSWSVTAREEPTAPPATQDRQEGAFPVRMSAVLKGISNYDAVNPGKIMKGDDKADGLFVLTVEAGNRVVNAVEIKNVDGVAAAWDTVPNSGKGSVGVAYVSDPARLLNKRDGSIEIRLTDRGDLNLYVADNGSISGGKTNFRITLSFADGGVSWCSVSSPSQPAPPPVGRDPVGKQPPTVNFLGKFLGHVSTDAVGRYPELKPDSQADAVFGLDIEVTPKNLITGIEINNPANPSISWGTKGAAAGAWGMAVAFQRSPNDLLNQADGSVRIPISGRSQLYLYVADPGNLTTPNNEYRMIVRLDDGDAYQQAVERPVGTTPSVVSGVQPDGPPLAKGLMTCEFRGFIVDLVNNSTKSGKDGYLDGTFLLKIKVDDKTITKIDIQGPDGQVRWSSQPKGHATFLGVAAYPTIYKLINPGGGAMRVPVGGRKTLHLYAADNGMLSDPNARLTVTATFSDQTSLSTKVIK
ncbi:MAG: hypothetical protein V2B18_12010 [Pseudomonadota bacterium]